MLLERTLVERLCMMTQVVRPADKRGIQTTHATTHKVWNDAPVEAPSHSCVWAVQVLRACSVDWHCHTWAHVT